MTVYTMTAYPKYVKTSDDHEITIRPMRADDGDALLEFFLSVSEEDRYYLKEDVTSAEVIRGWTTNLNYSRTLPLVALDGDRVIADGTLHRRSAGARKHVGELQIVVNPDYRNKGVSSALFREIVDIARDSELENLIFELVAEEQAPAIRTAESLGFVKLATLPNHARDVHGKPHDLIIMELPLGKWQEWWDF